MDQLLPKLAQNHPGLAKAIQINERYVLQERIKFLRSDEYDPIKAAERMGFYFDMKYDYFCGASSPCRDVACPCIARDLTVHDLTKEDLDYWRTGFYQVCREKDRAGRVVCIVFLPLCYRLRIPPEAMVRVYLVMNTILTQNVEVQKSGNVHIAYAVGLGEDSLSFIGSDHFANSVVKAGRYAPLRGVAKHFCYDHDSLHPMFGKYAKPMATFNAVRFRSHFGTNAEVLYNLMTFGISAASLPISDEGSVNTEFHNGFIDSLLQRQKQRDDLIEKRILLHQMHQSRFLQMQERGLESVVSILSETHATMSNSVSETLSNAATGSLTVGSSEIVALNPMDVVLRRGAHQTRNAGNLRLKLLLDENFEEYNSFDTNRARKTAIINGIMERMQKSGSRFVIAADDEKSSLYSECISEEPYRQWILASEDKIRDKISHDFRNLRRAEINSHKRNETEVEKKACVKRIIDLVDGARVLSTQERLSLGSLDAVSAVPMESSNGDESGSLGILYPGSLDVLLGRTNRKSNVGHILFKETLRDYQEEYEAANRSRTNAIANVEKTRVVHKVLARLDASNVRFLVRTSNGTWERALPEKVHDKITQDFRNLRWAKKNKRPASQTGN
jgi:hypothetical protein